MRGMCGGCVTICAERWCLDWKTSLTNMTVATSARGSAMIIILMRTASSCVLVMNARFARVVRMTIKVVCLIGNDIEESV